MITTSAEEQSVMRTDWVATLGILNFKDLGGRFLQVLHVHVGWHRSKKGRHQGCFCSWTLQTGKNRSVWVSGFHTYSTGLLVDRFYDIWSLVLCRLSDTGFRKNGNYTFHKFSFHNYLESGHTQALSHYRLGIQSHTSDIFHKFPVSNLECIGQHQGCSCGSQQSVEEQSV